MLRAGSAQDGEPVEPLGLVKKLGFVLAPARTRPARKQNAGLLVGSPSFAEAASRSRSQPKMEDNLFTPGFPK